MRRTMAQPYIDVEDENVVLPQDEPEISQVSSKTFRGKRFQCVAAHPDTSLPSVYRVMHIRSGYRPKQSLMASLPTFFSIHNQTVNTWTHFLGLIFFLSITPSTLRDAYERGTSTDVFMFSAYLVSACACMFFSTLFHLFSCANELWLARFFALDLIGISALILGSYMIGVYQGFYCHTPFIILYVCVVLGCVIMSGVLAVTPKFLDAKFDWLRNTMFVSTVAFAAVPLVHWLALCWNRSDSQCEMTFMSYCLAMLASYGIGFVFYAMKVPERFAPGYFDFFLHSHQWWHLFVFLGAAIWYYANRVFFDKRAVVDHAVC